MLNVRQTVVPFGDGVVFPAKTPGRSKSRAENIVGVGVGVKGKGQKTPFRAGFSFAIYTY